MNDDLIAFLHQQLENQRFRGESLKTLAFALPPETAAYLTDTGDLLLADVDAKRRILDEHQNVNDGDCGTCVNGRWGYPTHGGSSPQPWPCTTLRLLALPYADRPGYRDEWRP